MEVIVESSVSSIADYVDDLAYYTCLADSTSCSENSKPFRKNELFYIRETGGGRGQGG